MADKRKTASRQTQVAQPRAKTSAKPVKSISEMARDERNAESATLSDGKITTEKAARSASATASKDISVKDARKSEPAKVTKAAVTPVARNEQRKSPRRETKQPSWFTRLRQNRLGNFVYEAYYELRHKVTWPTFEEARNMTFVVIVLSAVIAAFLWAVDYGLYNLFLLISGGR